MPSSFTEGNSPVGDIQPNCQQLAPSPRSQAPWFCLFWNACWDSFPVAWAAREGLTPLDKGGRAEPHKEGCKRCSLTSGALEEVTVCYVRSSKASSTCREKSLGQQQPSAFKSPWAQLCCRSTQRPRWWPGTHHAWHRRGQERGTALVGGTGDPNRRQKGAGQRASPEASAGCRTKKLIFWLKSQGPYNYHGLSLSHRTRLK